MIVTSVLPQIQELAGAIDWLSVLKTALVFAVVFFAAGTILRLVFGKGSKVTQAVSACLSILLIYLAAILVDLFLPDYRSELAQLPFVTVDETRFVLWDLSGLADSDLYGSLLKLTFLAFLVNLTEALLPQGTRFLTWYLWRTVTVLGCLAVYSFLCSYLETTVPTLFTLWAKPIILCSWALILMSGILKGLLSIILTVVNPIVGALYAFFFSNLFGRQFSKSILTTVILVILAGVLNWIGFTQFAFSDFSLASYGPTSLILLLTLYLFGRFL